MPAIKLNCYTVGFQTATREYVKLKETVGILKKLPYAFQTLLVLSFYG
jgi:hypothetical protein